jgi:hypothetical protein
MEEAMKLFLVGMSIAVALCTTSSSVAGNIHQAARKGDLERVKSLLSLDAKQLNAQDQLGDTPLSLSAAYARWDLLRYLLEAGADVNVITRTNSTSVHCACYHDRADMVELLLQKGGAPCLQVKDVFGEYTPMLRAVQRGNRNVVSFLLERGVSPDEATKEGWNALHLAAKCGHRHLYGLLIEQGVSLDAKDQSGNTPMEYDFRRPDPTPLNANRYVDYVGRYSWQGKPEGPGVDIFIQENELLLDDNSINPIYPIGQDLFYCSHDPWEVKFLRSDAGEIDRVELVFLRRSVVLEKTK